MFVEEEEMVGIFKLFVEIIGDNETMISTDINCSNALDVSDRNRRILKFEILISI